MNEQLEVEHGNQNTSESKNKNSFLWRAISFLSILIVVIVVTALITFSYTINQFCYVADKNSAKLQTLTGLINENSYYAPDYDEMMDAALKAYVTATGDKYAQYYNAEEFAALNEENSGRYVGIGVTVREVTVSYQGKEINVLEIIRISNKSPAAEMGILVGDCIYSIITEDGPQYVEEIGKDAATALIKGEENTTVELSLLSFKNGIYEEFNATLIRKSVEIQSVSCQISETAPNVGIVTIYQFDLNTPKQLSDAMDTLKTKKIEKVILDLRDNGGGDLLSVVACSSYFAEKVGDIIVTSENNNKEQTEYLAIRRSYIGTYSPCSVTVEDIGKYRDFQFVVLVNENTASAAELLTAVFRDYGLATIVGEKTYGKGSMQTLFSLDRYGLQGGLKITTSLYYPPCGEGYNGIGIVPDIIVEASEECSPGVSAEHEDMQLICAIQVFQK